MSIVEQAALQMELEEDARGRLQADMSSRDAVQVLLDAGDLQDALKLLARLLPKRYAVAWVCQCARDQELPVEDRAGASLAEKWVREPSEGNRRAAYEFADAGAYESLGAWIAASAGWSGGSLAPAEQETPVPPPEHLTACAAAMAINMLAARDTERYAARQVEFIQRAMELLGPSGGASGAATKSA